MDECLALADLGASINLMPLSVWEGISLPKLTPTCMTLKLTNRSVSKPIGVAKDVSVKVGTGQDLIDVHKGELTLHIGNEAITYNLDQTSRYSANYNQMTTNKIDVIYEMYSQEVLGFSDTTANGNPTPYDDPIVSTTDFLLFEEADTFLGLEDDPNLPEFNPFYYDPEGYILLMEAILNSKPLSPLSNHEQYLPSFKKELKVCEAKTVKSSVDEPPKGDKKLPVIIAKELGDEDKSALIKSSESDFDNPSVPQPPQEQPDVDFEPDSGNKISVVMKNNDKLECLNPRDEFDDDYFFVIYSKMFLSFLSAESEDTIFDPGITIYRFYLFKPGLSHRCGTFKKFNTHRSQLNESPMEMITRIVKSLVSCSQFLLRASHPQLHFGNPTFMDFKIREEQKNDSVTYKLNAKQRLKKAQEKDKIETKPNKNGK
nr:reverse transcriptase domain-containing protein [Tanacetum cinerariifolium]